jgi:hypothetical protein
MRRRITVAVLACACAASGAPASGKSLEAKYRTLRAEVVQKHGKRAPGRHILRDGVRTRHGSRPARIAEIVKSIKTFRRMLAPAPPPATGPAPASSGLQSQATTSASSGSSNPMVNPACESGGNPQAVDPSGTYWGKYQFDSGTWAAHGGDPGAYGNASEQEQDQVAARVRYDAWPNC